MVAQYTLHTPRLKKEFDLVLIFVYRSVTYWISYALNKCLFSFISVHRVLSYHPQEVPWNEHSISDLKYLKLLNNKFKNKIYMK